ncbi:MAG TPA: sulfatase-like hydrolase/transferase [Terriglobia bacterium]
MITIDTLRADHVGCYGDKSIRTPALDHLAADGIRFANAFTPSPITNASHASILTGLVPTRHGVRDFGMPLSADVPTVAEILKAHGYSTAAFIGAIILDSHSLAPGFDRGFDYYDNFPPDLPKSASRYVRLERRGMEVEQRAESWMRSHRTQPQFIWVHLYDPHDPYDPPPPYDTEYAGRLYDGEIAYADAALGRLVEFLKGQSRYDSSTLIVVGDHGEGLGDHGEQTHGIFLYDSTTHVPLILKLPRSHSDDGAASPVRSMVVGAQARTIDIFPTVLDLVGIHDQKPVDGASLRPLWAEAALEGSGLKPAASPAAASIDRVAFGETDYPLGFGWAPLRSARTPLEKYIEAPRPEFYDLGVDPREATNLYEPWSPEVQRLRALVADLRKASGPGDGLAGNAGEVSSAKIAELKALGYLGNNPGSTTAPEPSLLPDPKDEIQVFNLIHSSMLAAEDGKAAQARRDLESALNLDPKSGVVLAQLGELELEQGDYAQAAELLARALRVRPWDATAALDEARARYATRDLEGARSVLEANESILTGNYEARCLLGKIYVELKAWDKAEDLLQAAIILDSSRPEAYIELARAYLALTKPADALEQLEQAQLLDPRSPEISLLISQAHQQEGKSNHQPPTTSHQPPSSNHCF